MEVTFHPKIGNKDCWEIFVDGEKWREVHRTIFGKNPVLSSPSSEKNLQSMFDELEYQRAKKYVLWRLSAQNYHSQLLSQLLRARLVQDHTINRVIDDCHKMHLLNDDSWLQSFMKKELKRYSLRVVLRKLHAKGFVSETLEDLAQEWNSENEVMAIWHLLQTKYKKKDLTEVKERQKCIAALMRKGYSYEKIKRALND